MSLCTDLDKYFGDYNSDMILMPAKDAQSFSFLTPPKCVETNSDSFDDIAKQVTCEDESFNFSL